MVDETVTHCSVCGGKEFLRYGCYAPEGDDQATEFAKCKGCGTRYLYKRPAPKEDHAAP